MSIKPATKMAVAAAASKKATAKMTSETKANYWSMALPGHLVSKLYGFGTNDK